MLRYFCTEANDNDVDLFSCETINVLQNQFYEDDGLYRRQAVSASIQIVNEARDLCKLCQLRPHKFVSDRRQLMSYTAEFERAETTRYVDLNFHYFPSEGVLGIN